MGSWQEILNEVSESPFDRIRRKYLKNLHARTERNIVCYYSGWLQKTDPKLNNIVSITDEDKGGFMSCFHGIDCSKGLDLILHSPGGRVTSTESLVNYLRAKFDNNIRVFIPQISMSGGTLLALSGKEIWMGSHSNLGPIDPQFGQIPAVTLIEEFERAYTEIKADPVKFQVWQPILSQIAPAFLSMAKQAIDLSEEIAIKALASGMFADQKNGNEIATKIAKELTNAKTHKAHDRHIHREECKKIGLVIKNFEEDQDFQDAVLSLHHAFMVTLANSGAAKIIENHTGSAFVKQIPMQLI